MLEIKELKTNKIGYPVTPSKWTKEPTYQKISKITISTGGGLGAYARTEYVERIYGIPTLKLNTYTRIDGKQITLNLDYIISIEDFTLVTCEFITLNVVYGNIKELYKEDPEEAYDKYGNECTARYLIEDGVEVELVEEFMGR